MKHTFVRAIALPACGLILAGLTLNSAEIAPAVLERGPHHKVLETASGGAYTVLADGMHYESDGQLLESKEEIELFQDGAMARQGQHKVVFAPNLKTPGA